MGSSANLLNLSPRSCNSLAVTTPSEILTQAITVRRETFRILAASFESLHRSGELPSGSFAVAPLVSYLVKDGVSFRRLAVELSAHGFRRSAMWYQRGLARGGYYGGAGTGL